jgi:hypothetical protein
MRAGSSGRRCRAACETFVISPEGLQVLAVTGWAGEWWVCMKKPQVRSQGSGKVVT